MTALILALGLSFSAMASTCVPIELFKLENVAGAPSQGIPEDVIVTFYNQNHKLVKIVFSKGKCEFSRGADASWCYYHNNSYPTVQLMQTDNYYEPNAITWQRNQWTLKTCHR